MVKNDDQQIEVCRCCGLYKPLLSKTTLRLHRMSWGVKTTCFKAPGVSLGGSGVSIGGVRSLRVIVFLLIFWIHKKSSTLDGPLRVRSFTILGPWIPELGTEKKTTETTQTT